MCTLVHCSVNLWNIVTDVWLVVTIRRYDIVIQTITYDQRMDNSITVLYTPNTCTRLCINSYSTACTVGNKWSSRHLVVATCCNTWLPKGVQDTPVAT